MKLELGIIRDLPNKDYHGDREYLSSSGLKLLLKDPKEFHKKYILNQDERKESNAFDEGSYAHSLILEPHKIEEEYRFFPGFSKRGKEWDEFKESHKGFYILSKAQKVRTEDLVQGYHNNEVAKTLMIGTDKELTCLVEIDGVKIKVRADAIHLDAGYIVDVKTTGFSAEHGSFKMTIKQFGYDLSAALYSMAFSKHLNKPFDFYFLVLSKQDGACEVFKTSRETMENGMAQVREAIRLYKKYTENGWNFDDKSITSQPEALDVKYEILEV
jgi:hypothetical protein